MTNNATRTHCGKGHELAVVGTYSDGTRGWKCRQCSRDYDRMLRERRREAKERAEAAGIKTTVQMPEPTGDADGALDMFLRAETAMPWERDALKERARRIAAGHG